MGDPRHDYRFAGFPEGGLATVPLPEFTFTDLVPHIQDLDELKVVLLVLWRLAEMQSDAAPWITCEELRAEPVVRAALAGGDFEMRLQAALEKAVDHRILLAAPWEAAEEEPEVRYFANSPRGRAAVAAMERGTSPRRAVVETTPNIFALYEQNVGPLTALLTEDLMEAEATYPAAWIEAAFREAVRLNKRNWKYILAILERWQSEGRDEIDRRTGQRAGDQTDRNSRESETRRYIRDASERIVHH